MTSSMPLKRATNCANAPYQHILQRPYTMKSHGNWTLTFKLSFKLVSSAAEALSGACDGNPAKVEL